MGDKALLRHYLELFSSYRERYGYIIEGFGLPAPRQSLIIAGTLLVSQREMHIVALFLVAWTAAVICDNIGYALGRFGGRWICWFFDG